MGLGGCRKDTLASGAGLWAPIPQACPGLETQVPEWGSWGGSPST